MGKNPLWGKNPKENLFRVFLLFSRDFSRSSFRFSPPKGGRKVFPPFGGEKSPHRRWGAFRRKFRKSSCEVCEAVSQTPTETCEDAPDSSLREETRWGETSRKKKRKQSCTQWNPSDWKTPNETSLLSAPPSQQKKIK